ncbi:2-oxoisovalerate dehydrogenase subunit beta,pyruvate dehydrogenase subunit beta,Pyruvate/2-oxoglutarate dehydrogenase complex, dehydrogenase (E1) component, eukaryotic type, beta subunit,pyruvate dehydrogenase (acetyl-transferring) E1 component, alpha subunit,Transketolase, pyrimidine binding domain [Chlamydia serpentis]|uniref:3-methyl-2-oxobutanoate dehydrogenase (2-methylpropanoyl-transferring) n=1 Tax=Chlamydia serpentis TaxID=1967782 RepID=A0A2R8FA64_9CHLA|nr:thiamine pyrophosphate-dependent enzyme [Chlamydia serpentis]SPN73212.1 2-oxoisovalerate dehydrogenase subunit beta,pyruvate dehydrogenase subunit beta,Pyruvate/2-oxoglutarate dehydrogenase complex, dehydrogenase (E1) component, eukaryotic type, beta subunit,pyruvate dehydrogenase (acetyl-transferring) E1 component, alpha subunit,Transketolase, pyrimidine binding domain [Chlamydia serpentis]
MEVVQNQVISSIRDVLKLVWQLRFAEHKMLLLSRQSGSGGSFQLSCGGHELAGVLGGKSLIPGKDWSFPYYRDQGFPLGLGCDLSEIFASFLARMTVNHSSGRMMPYHYSHKKLRICCQSSVVGTQFLQAAGRAWAVKHSQANEVVYVSGGDGATSQGEFHEMLNFVSLHQLPLVTVIQNNHWAISVPFEEQCGADLARLGNCYHGLAVYEVSGGEYTSLSETFSLAVNQARHHSQPSLILIDMVRLGSHSNSDNQEKYRSPLELKLCTQKDPLVLLEKDAVDIFGLSSIEVEEIKAEAQEEVQKACQIAEALPFPIKGSTSHEVFSPYTEALIDYENSENAQNLRNSEPKVMRDAIAEALMEEMSRDSGVIVFGEDVAGDKGGVFGVTRNLTEKFGHERCFNSPLAEATIIGTAIGMALDGIHKPVVEIQFADYIWPGINQLFSEASSIYYRSAGEWEVPLVIRAPSGGYIQGGPYHSQSIEAFLAHCPGIKVAYPSNAADAKALLKAAIRDPNPVVFLEHKALYQRRIFSACPVFSSDYVLPFGKAVVVHPGTDLTLVSWGMPLVLSIEVAQELGVRGISIEVIDLRTIVPCDFPTVLKSVEKTGRLLVVHEASEFCGFGSELVATISEQGYTHLDAPVRRLGGLHSPVPYSKILENEVLPQKDSILQAAKSLAEF